jgi:hypothetical protein
MRRGDFQFSDSGRQRVPIPATANRSAYFCPSSGNQTNVGTRLVFQISLHLFTGGERCEFGLVTRRQSCTVRSYFTSRRTRAGTLFAPRRNCQDASDPSEIGHHHRNQQDTVHTADRADAIDIPSVRDRFRIKNKNKKGADVPIDHAIPIGRRWHQISPDRGSMYGAKNSPTAAVDCFDTCNGGTDANKTRRVPIRPTCSSQVFQIRRCVREIRAISGKPPQRLTGCCSEQALAR